MRPVTYSLFVIFGCFAAVNAGGIRLNNNQAGIALGPYGDVRLARSGPGKLKFTGDVKIGGLVRVLKGLKMDGLPLEEYIERRVMAALNNDGEGLLKEICKGIKELKSILPFHLNQTLPDVVHSLVPREIVDPKRTVPQNMIGALNMLVLGNATDDHLMSLELGKLSPLPVDTNKNLPESIDDIVKELLPVNTSQSLDLAIHALVAVLPLDESKSLSETVAALIPILLGLNSTETIEEFMTVPLSKLSPVPLDQGLPKILETLMEAFQLPVNTTDSIPQALTALMAVLPLDTNRSLSETIAGLLPMILGINSTENNSTENILEMRIDDLMPLNTSQNLPEAVDMVLKMMELPFNTTESMHEAIITLIHLLPLDKSLTLSETIVTLTALFMGVNSTTSEVVDELLKERVEKLLPIPFNTSQTLVDNIVQIVPLLLPFGNMTIGQMTDMMPATISALLNVLPLPNDVNKMLAETVASMLPTLWDDLPVDKTMTVPQTIGTLVPIVLGNASLTVPMREILPVPFDTTKSLPQNVDEMLKVFDLPVDTTKENVIEVLTALVKDLPFDQSRTVPETIAAMLPMLLGVNSTHEINLILSTSIKEFSPVDTSNTLAETVDMALKSLELPMNTSESLHGAVASLLPLLPLDETKPIPVAVAEMVVILITGSNNTESELMTGAITQYLPLPLNESKNLTENVNIILKMLDLPLSTDENLPEAITGMMKQELQLDTTRTLSETIVAMLPMMLGVNATDVDEILETSIGKFLPLPLDTSKSIGDTILAMLPMLLPLPNITTASLSDTVEMMMQAMDVNTTELASQTMTAMLKQILPEMAKDQEIVDGVSKLVPRNTSKFIMSKIKNGTVTQIAREVVSKLPFNSSKQLASETIHQLLPDDEGKVVANMIGTLLGTNETHHILSLVNFDPNKPPSEMIEHVMGILQDCDEQIFE